MEIKRFTKAEEKEWREFIRKYNNVREFDILNITTFPSKEKEIYMIIENGLFRKYKFIAYCIIEKELKDFTLLNMIDKSYGDANNMVYLTDFMVRISKRNQGIGKEFAGYILNEICKGKDVILNPDADGYWFWKKFGFIDDKISKHKTWILRKNDKNIKNEAGEIV